MSSRRSAIPADSLLQLRQRLDRLPPKSPERATQVAAFCSLVVFEKLFKMESFNLFLFDFLGNFLRYSPGDSFG